MILFDLRCTKDHVFEAWFRDSAAYEKQAKAHQIACPECGSRKVEKAPMAPRIGKGQRRAGTPATPMPEEVRRQLIELRRKIEDNCEYVGGRFAEEARRIHSGEVKRRDIYGEATKDEARELEEEGVEFARVPWVPRHDS